MRSLQSKSRLSIQGSGVGGNGNRKSKRQGAQKSSRTKRQIGTPGTRLPPNRLAPCRFGQSFLSMSISGRRPKLSAPQVRTAGQARMLSVEVRDIKFKLRLSSTDEDFKWVSNVAKLKYVTYMRFKFKIDELEVLETRDRETKKILQPDWKISKYLEKVQEKGVVVTLKRHNGDDIRSMWQVIANTPRDDWIDFTIIYDGKVAAAKAVRMFTNVNGYSESLSLVRKGRKMAARLKVPPYSPLRFYFVGEGIVEVSSIYDVIFATGAKGTPQRMNEIHVADSFVAPDIEVDPWDTFNGWTPTEKPKKKEEEIFWEYEIPRVPTGDEFESLFARDWREIQLNDVVPQASDRKDVKTILYQYWNDLQQIFRAYSCLKIPISFMDQSTFSLLIAKLKIYTKKFTVSNVSQIFVRVNVDEDYGSDEELDGVDLKRGMQISSDPDNPSNQFIRSEFLEALVRISLVKWRKIGVGEGFKRLIEEHILPKQKSLLEGFIRLRREMDTLEVKRAFNPFLRSLFTKCFLPIAMLDEGMKPEEDRKDDVATASMSIDEYTSWLKDIELFGKGSELKRREAYKAYCMPIEPQFNGELMSEDSEMQWPEFLEMLYRIAPCIYPKEKTVIEALTKLLKFLVGKKGVMVKKKVTLKFGNTL